MINNYNYLQKGVMCIEKTDKNIIPLKDNYEHIKKWFNLVDSLLIIAVDIVENKDKSKYVDSEKFCKIYFSENFPFIWVKNAFKFVKNLIKEDIIHKIALIEQSESKSVKDSVNLKLVNLFYIFDFNIFEKLCFIFGFYSKCSTKCKNIFNYLQNMNQDNLPTLELCFCIISIIFEIQYSEDRLINLSNQIRCFIWGICTKNNIIYSQIDINQEVINYLNNVDCYDVDQEFVKLEIKDDENFIKDRKSVG
jgi:hypothetical protein